MHWENMADLMVVFAVWAYLGGFLWLTALLALA